MFVDIFQELKMMISDASELEENSRTQQWTQKWNIAEETRGSEAPFHLGQLIHQSFLVLIALTCTHHHSRAECVVQIQPEIDALSEIQNRGPEQGANGGMW